ncbi:MAG: hypothetical protein ACM3WU_07700 [Bacillota bacterium]
MSRLAINSVIETVVGDRVVAQDRVLWVSPDGRDVVVISLLNPERALPVFKEAQEIRAAIANGDAVIRTTDPVTNPVLRQCLVREGALSEPFSRTCGPG